MKDETVLALTAMVSLTAIMIVCLILGIDSLILAGVVTTIAGLGGYNLKAWRETRSREGETGNGT